MSQKCLRVSVLSAGRATAQKSCSTAKQATLPLFVNACQKRYRNCGVRGYRLYRNRHGRHGRQDDRALRRQRNDYRIRRASLDLTQAELTFTVGTADIAAKATYKYIDYTVTVTDGTADKTTAHYGDTVSITAGEAPEGKVFDKWTCETAGVTIEFASATSASTTFIMPAGDISVKANYRNVEEAPSFEIKVNGGTGAGTYKEGESVTVTANDPEEGKIFKGWKDESGNIVSTEKVYTFTVSGEVSLTAVYEDKPTGGDGTGGDKTPEPDKGGLSTGAIVGIAVGSVAVAGLGGFAIFWFIIRKKSFADLIAVFRKKK